MGNGKKRRKKDGPKTFYFSFGSEKTVTEKYLEGGVFYFLLFGFFEKTRFFLSPFTHSLTRDKQTRNNIIHWFIEQQWHNRNRANKQETLNSGQDIGRRGTYYEHSQDIFAQQTTSHTVQSAISGCRLVTIRRSQVKATPFLFNFTGTINSPVTGRAYTRQRPRSARPESFFLQGLQSFSAISDPCPGLGPSKHQSPGQPSSLSRKVECYPRSPLGCQSHDPVLPPGSKGEFTRTVKIFLGGVLF